MKLFQRYYAISFIFLLMSSSLCGMVLDNRYFPWLPHLYNGSDHRHGSLAVEPFFITSSSAWKVGTGSNDREVGYPNLQGSLDFKDVSKAFVLAGLENPIPVDWQWIGFIPMEMPGSFEGQGLSIAGYVPVSDHFGVGASMLFLRLIAQANLVPSKNVVDQLNLSSAGNKAQFVQMTEGFESAINTQDGYWNQSGVGDTEIYARLFDVQEYAYYCRKIDSSLAVGLFIPTGVPSSSHFIGSVPFGGDGFWGWYFAPSVEVELKEDWKIGFEWRIEKRFAKTIEHRICVANESNLFAPVSGPLYIMPGVTAAIMPYVALENMREGLGILFKYTYVIHKQDNFQDRRTVQSPAANFENMIKNSEWRQEYATLELLYDLSFKHDWSYKPMCTLTWDFPLNALGARGSSKTHRIALGLMVDF